MEGCFEGAACTNGSCVVDGESARSCSRDADCPDFQACIGGSCYSNCEYDSECGGMARCYRHACRVPCAAEVEADCSAGTTCQLVDSDFGYCMPEVLPTSGISPASPGSYEVNVDFLEFTNNRRSRTLTITNDGPHSIDFTVRKVSHTEPGASDVEVTVNPMHWLGIGAVGAPLNVNEYLVRVPGSGGQAIVELRNATNQVPLRWTGVLLIESPLGERRINLEYSTDPRGRWAGKVYYFTQFGEENLPLWEADRTMPATTAGIDVGNAFIRKWSEVRSGMSVPELNAIVTSTVNGTWRWPSIQSACPSAACYPFSNTTGVVSYSTDLTQYPIPSGVVEMPIALDLAPNGSMALRGRIATDQSLHYAGNPQVDLHFATDPTACAPGLGSACLAFVESMEASVVVGGRYRPTANDTECSRLGTMSGFERVQVPWLVPGFHDLVEFDAEAGAYFRSECRDSLQPLGLGEDEALVNLSLAGSNPIPDGQSRQRRLELVDGVLINQEQLYLVFRETFAEEFFGASSTAGGLTAYGLMVLSRGTAELDDDDFVGTVQAETRTGSVPLEEIAGCSPEVLGRIGFPGGITAGNANSAVGALLSGTATAGPGPTAIPTAQMHYLCHDTGRIDGGNDPGFREACPVGSNATYFRRNVAAGYMQSLPCQSSGTCQATLDAWLADPTVSPQVTIEPPYRCDVDGVYCEEVRTDLIRGHDSETGATSRKTFYEPLGPGAPVYVPLATTIDRAFRYKTQFRNRQGRNIGFTPAVCQSNSNAVPYCYDPVAIEEIRGRTDCLAYVFDRHFSNLSAATQSDLRRYLARNFSYDQTIDPLAALPFRTEGFEQLNAELLVMLGDEAFTRAFQSRFDLAGSSQVSFQGSLFEPGGIDLAGVAGFEMYSLYQSAQYYQMVLDRFYALSPYVWASIERTGEQDAGRRFIDAATVTSYFQKVLRASSQAARAWSEVAKRYQSFNRADLARFAVERAYTSAYLESLVVARLMQSTASAANATQQSQINLALEQSATVYKIALLDMREVYANLTDEINYFGFSPDYIPLPPLAPGGPNSFEAMIARAQQSAATASQREDLAISSNRSFETDAVAFQNELTRIGNTYENQLAEICGTFVGDDGNVYAATPTLGYLSPPTRALGDPCGLVGNGELHNALANIELQRLEMRSVRAAAQTVWDEIEIETERAAEQCGVSADLAGYRYTVRGDQLSLQDAIRDSQQSLQELERFTGFIGQVASLGKCSVGLATDCPTGAVALAIYTGLYAINEIEIQSTQRDVNDLEDEIAQLERGSILVEAGFQCDQVEADSRATVQRLLLQLRQTDLQMVRADINIRLAVAEVNRIRNRATRLIAEQTESEQLTIDLEAARNDPNVRIYRNDAVINADRSFYDAIRDAYRATRVFEYYTSQSYARRDELTLVRLVSRGDYNLENYLFDLQTAYYEFEDINGRPDSRVEIVSLRDDILRIPRSGTSGALSQAERTEMLRVELTDPRWLNPRGHISIPFATALDRLSPLTRNHKIDYIEVEVVGSDIGDTLGRIYVGQSGTGTIRPLEGIHQYYRFPERTAVVDPFFNGVRVFGAEVYRNDRLRDRPIVNTNWELVINQRDERVNQDIKLNSITDVRVYIYYTDFTAL
jgi:hypothetical protein